MDTPCLRGFRFFFLDLLQRNLHITDMLKASLILLAKQRRMPFSTSAGRVVASEEGGFGCARTTALNVPARRIACGSTPKLSRTTLDECFSTISPIANFRIFAGVISLQWRPRWLELPQDRSHEERLHDYAAVTRPSRRVHVDIEAWWYHFDASGPGIDDDRGPEP
jgi:hypothetical protein